MLILKCFILRYAPFGIMFLVAGKILEIDDMGNTARKLGLYMITVIVGLMIHCFFTLCVIYFIVTRKNPFKFYYGCLQVDKLKNFLKFLLKIKLLGSLLKGCYNWIWYVFVISNSTGDVSMFGGKFKNWFARNAIRASRRQHD